MKQLHFLLSLTNDDNDYQQEQAAAADKAAHRLGVEVKIIHANNDSLTQSQQILQYVQAPKGERPDAILFEPAGGTAFPQVARAAAAAGIGWVVLNHDVDYIAELRQQFSVPIFGVSSDHEAVGKIQGNQFGALLPEGGSVLYIEGPMNSSAAAARTRGMNRTKPDSVQVKSLHANWTEQGSRRIVSSWLRLRTSLESHIDLVGAQDDSMAMGAKKAFAEVVGAQRERWMKVPITGCDGMPNAGQKWVRDGTLAATIHTRPNADLAIELMLGAIAGGTPLPEMRLTQPVSVPELGELKPIARGQAKPARA
jgi:ribose transport system substrate-binding protein